MVDEEILKFYHRKKNWFFLLQILIIFLFLVIMMFSFSQQIRNAVYNLTENSVMVVALYSFVAYAFYLVFIFPLKVYSEFILERRYELSNQSFGNWFKKFLNKELLYYCVILFVLETVYTLIETQPKWWWAYAVFGWVFYNVFIRMVLPTIINPLFYKRVPLGNNDFKQRLVALASRAYVKVPQVYVLNVEKDPRNANVFLFGLGLKRSIMLTDTLQDYASEEVEVMLARELAALYYDHGWQWTFFYAGTAGAGFFLIDFLYDLQVEFLGFKLASDIGAFPVLGVLFLIFFVFTLPFKNMLSRKFESQTDLFSLKLTRLPEAFVSVLVRVAKQQVNDPKPNRFIKIMLYEHIPFIERMRLAEDYAQNVIFSTRKF